MLTLAELLSGVTVFVFQGGETGFVVQECG